MLTRLRSSEEQEDIGGRKGKRTTEGDIIKLKRRTRSEGKKGRKKMESATEFTEFLCSFVYVLLRT
jgi:allophanate hydrolase subunit 2